MAGEWIAYDLALPDKPEVQELIDLTGEPVEAVVFNLLRLWGWASMHCGDGTARMTLPRLVRTCGADEAFWRAVAAVGWLEIDADAATVAVPGWDRRFSQAAKSRMQHRERAAAQNDKDPGRRQPKKTACAQAQALPAPERSRGEENRGDNPPPPLVVATPEQAAGTLRAAWASAARAGHVQPYRAKAMPDGFAARISEAGWLEEALRAIEHLPKCRYFDTPATLIQLCGKGFVTKCLAGQYDPKKPAKGGSHPPGGLEGRRTAEEAASEWTRGANDPERQRARQAYLDAKAAKAANRPPPPPPAEVPDEFDLERDRVAMVAQLRKQGVA